MRVVVVCRVQESCVSDPSVRNTKKLRDKPNLLASIRVRAASDGAGAGSESQIPWLRPGPATGLRSEGTLDTWTPLETHMYLYPKI